MTGKRILVTGSEGFTGVYVRQEFRTAGWEVWGAGLAAKPDDPRYIQIDLQDATSLVQCADIRPDVVIHACRTGICLRSPIPRCSTTSIFWAREI